MRSSEVPVRVTLDAVLTERRMRAKELAETIGLSETQLSLFRSGKVRGIRFETIAKLCAALACKPGDLLDYSFDPEDLTRRTPADEG